MLHSKNLIQEVNFLSPLNEKNDLVFCQIDTSRTVFLNRSVNFHGSYASNYYIWGKHNFNY